MAKKGRKNCRVKKKQMRLEGTPSGHHEVGGTEGMEAQEKTETEVGWELSREDEYG